MKEREIEDISRDSGLGKKDRDEIARINKLLAEAPDPEPSGLLDEKFYRMLDKESLNEGQGRGGLFDRLSVDPVSLRRSMRIVAGIALFLLGWFGATITVRNSGSGDQLAQLSSEIGSLKQSLVLTMMQMNSPSERIQAVSMVEDMNEVDDKITGSLLMILNSDPNENVRLVALEALLDYSEYPGVREGLIRSISMQESPLIQIRLAESMALIGERRSADEFMKIINDLTVDYNVRLRIGETIESLL